MSTLSNLLESILNNALVDYLSKHNIIAKTRYDFINWVSTDDAITDLTKSVVDKLDIKLKCYGIFLDLFKAFDTVSVST